MIPVNAIVVSIESSGIVDVNTIHESELNLIHCFQRSREPQRWTSFFRCSVLRKKLPFRERIQDEQGSSDTLLDRAVVVVVELPPSNPG